MGRLGYDRQRTAFVTSQAPQIPSDRMRVLLLFAHPDFDRSRVNRRLLAAARDVEGVEIHDLYEAYPDFGIDVRAEQERLEAAQSVVLQHPMYWYSTPSLVKEWFDLVLEHGWAYGSEGMALEGKNFLSAISAGGRRAAYGAEGAHRYTIPELLRPIEQTVRLCRMHWLPPFAAVNAHRIEDDELDRVARLYGDVLRALATGEVPPAADPRQCELINDLFISEGQDTD